MSAYCWTSLSGTHFPLDRLFQYPEPPLSLSVFRFYWEFEIAESHTVSLDFTALTAFCFEFSSRKFWTNLSILCERVLVSSLITNAVMWWIKPRVNKMITWWGIWWSWDRQNLTWSSKSSSRDHFIVTETRGPWKKKAISTDAWEQWYNYPAGRSLIFLPAIKKVRQEGRGGLFMQATVQYEMPKLFSRQWLFSK